MEMSGERIGMVLVRASELHSKIATCIHKSSLPPHSPDENGNNHNEEPKLEDNDEDDDALFTICDAFHSLESHLSSLQALHQQQQYERESVIRDIEYNRKLLLKKLSEYKGEHLDVIREAQAFASMKVELDNELLLPPYPTLSTGLGSSSSDPRKLNQNGHYNSDESKKCQSENRSSKVWGGVRFLLSSTAKTMLTLVGVISILSSAGFEPMLKKKGITFTALNLNLNDSEEKRETARYPPGKVRVEIPFDSVASDPDVNYGCG